MINRAWAWPAHFDHDVAPCPIDHAPRPPCTKATELLLRSRFADVRDLLDVRMADKLRTSGGCPEAFQCQVYNTLIQRVLRDKRVQESPDFATSTLCALLGPLVEDSAEAGALSAPAASAGLADASIQDDPFADMLVPDGSDAGEGGSKDSEGMGGTGVAADQGLKTGLAPELFPVFQTLLSILQPATRDIKIVSAALHEMTRKDRHQILQQFTNPAEGQRIVDLATREMAGQPKAPDAIAGLACQPSPATVSASCAALPHPLTALSDWAIGPPSPRPKLPAFRTAPWPTGCSSLTGPHSLLVQASCVDLQLAG